VKEGTLIATVDVGMTSNTGYCTTLDGRSNKSFRFDNTKEGFEKFWCMTIASKNRFGCDEVLVGYESTGPYAAAHRRRRWTEGMTSIGFALGLGIVI
jgi:hypothetical protein